MRTMNGTAFNRQIDAFAVTASAFFPWISAPRPAISQAIRHRLFVTDVDMSCFLKFFDQIQGSCLSS